MNKVKKVLGIIAVILSAVVIVGVFMQIFGKGKVKPSEWFKSSTEITQPKDGVDGKDGIDGKDGKDGETPYIGENGNWFIGDTDTGVRAQGVDGKDGKDGETPYIGADGNWYIGKTNTGVKATKYIYIQSTPEDIITDDYETYFNDEYTVNNAHFINSPDKLHITSGDGNDGRAYCARLCSGERLYRNSTSYGLKMETHTEVSFEIDKPMTLYLWLDRVSTSSTEVTWYPSVMGIMVDGIHCTASKVSDDVRGYALTMRLSAGRHSIRKDEQCVLSYLSLTP